MITYLEGNLIMRVEEGMPHAVRDPSPLSRPARENDSPIRFHTGPAS